MSKSFQNVPPESESTFWERRAGNVTVAALSYLIGQIRIQVLYAYGYGNDVISPEI